MLPGRHVLVGLQQMCACACMPPALLAVHQMQACLSLRVVFTYTVLVRAYIHAGKHAGLVCNIIPYLLMFRRAAQHTDSSAHCAHAGAVRDE